MQQGNLLRVLTTKSLQGKVPIFGKMQLCRVKHFYNIFCLHFWAWLLNTIAITPKSEDKYVVTVFNPSEFHFSEVTFFQNSTFKTDIIKVCLVSSISNFFINNIYPANKLSVKKIPSCANLALVHCVSYYCAPLYSSNKIRKAQNEHLNIVCQNLNSL